MRSSRPGCRRGRRQGLRRSSTPEQACATPPRGAGDSAVSTAGFCPEQRAFLRSRDAGRAGRKRRITSAGCASAGTNAMRPAAVSKTAP
jgi:hypothetical protein